MTKSLNAECRICSKEYNDYLEFSRENPLGKSL